MKKLFIVLLVIFSISTVYGQSDSTVTKKKKFFSKDKITVGGNIGADFGTNTSIYIAPRIGYYFTPSTVLGTQIAYQYTASANVKGNHSYGTGLWARQYLLERRFYLHGESEFLNRQQTSETRKWVNSTMLGGGYFQSISGRSGVSASVLYIVNYKKATSPYPSPWVIRVGVSL